MDVRFCPLSASMYMIILFLFSAQSVFDAHDAHYKRTGDDQSDSQREKGKGATTREEKRQIDRRSSITTPKSKRATESEPTRTHTHTHQPTFPS